MPLPGFIQLYNRLPYDFEFMSNGTPYLIAAHTVETATVAMAMCAIKQSMYKMTIDGNPLFGVVAFGDPDFNSPLTDNDLHTGDPILGNTMEFTNPEEMVVLKVNTAGVMPIRRGAVNPKMDFMAGRGNN